MSARPLSRAAILAVGSELLGVGRVDTNSLHITGVLDALGVAVAFKAVVGDSVEELTACFRHALARVDLVVLSGGLGPTADDVTRDVVSAALDRPMAEDAAVTDGIRRRFAARGWTMPEINRRQAMVPRGAVVLANPNGTAPGLWIEHGDQAILLLPGPPREMKPMLDLAAAAHLKERAGGRIIARRVVKVAGRGESRVDELVQPIYAPWQQQEPAIDTTILASTGLVELHLSASGSDRPRLDRALGDAVGQLQEALGHDVFSVDDESLEEVVGHLLLAAKSRVALAESCTGGLVTSRLTDVAGASAYVDRTVVAYSNQAKIDWLGVPAELIDMHGAVSEPVAVAMAEGVRSRANVEFALAITGIAGPTGGTPTKPVGTVCIAVSGSASTEVRSFSFVGNRESIKAFASFTALDMLRRKLLEIPAKADWQRRPPLS